MASAAGQYAQGRQALGHCARCDKKRLLRTLVYDGQYPDLLVCPECWDPKHPQEYMPSVTDPVTLYDPTGDLDKIPANTQVISWPTLKFITRGIITPLQIGIVMNKEKYTIAGGSVTDA